MRKLRCRHDAMRLGSRCASCSTDRTATTAQMLARRAAPTEPPPRHRCSRVVQHRPNRHHGTDARASCSTDRTATTGASDAHAQGIACLSTHLFRKRFLCTRLICCAAHCSYLHLVLSAQPLPLLVSPAHAHAINTAERPKIMGVSSWARRHQGSLHHSGHAKRGAIGWPRGGIGHRARADSACSSDRRREAASALIASSFSASAAARSRSRRSPALNFVSTCMIRHSAVRRRPSLCSSCRSRRRVSRSKRVAMALALFSAHAIC